MTSTRKIKIKFKYTKTVYKSYFSVKLCRQLLKKYLKHRLRNEQKYSQINLLYVFVSTREQKQINIDYLNHNYNTDIITFNLSEESDTLDGEMYISLKQIKKNAIRYKTEIFQEINRVLIHGCLHLMGYDDKVNKDEKRMRKEEEKYLTFINRIVPRGTQINDQLFSR